VRELRQPPVRRSARRPASIVCWWQSCDQHDTRRHTATLLMMMLLLRPPAARFSYGVFDKHAALKDQQFRAAFTFMALISRACARGARRQ
jgi:hypothetical protein